MYGDLLFAPDMRRTIARLAAFCVASIGLHAVTLIAYAPRGFPVATDTASATVLRATLSRPGTVAVTATETPLEPPSTAPDPAASDTVRENTRSGMPDGLDLPVPDKWFTGTEVDLRAEPLSHVTIEYPEELSGSGIAGRVRVVLFIDEFGSVRKISVVEAMPEGVFEKAAARAWNDVRFSPAMKNGIAVKSRKVVELSYLPF